MPSDLSSLQPAMTLQWQCPSSLQGQLSIGPSPRPLTILDPSLQPRPMSLEPSSPLGHQPSSHTLSPMQKATLHQPHSLYESLKKVIRRLYVLLSPNVVSESKMFVWTSSSFQWNHVPNWGCTLCGGCTHGRGGSISKLGLPPNEGFPQTGVAPLFPLRAWSKRGLIGLY